ncbi:MAG: hypothetical protein HY862_20600 [Chloroflexi bacterium]|nr:hypothetical protein [Chloroflexota bacterium]
MQISQGLEEMPLHDAIVSSISYHLRDKTLVIKLQLADWEDELGESGTLTFFQVENLKTNPLIEDIDWENCSADIWNVDHRSDLDKDQFEGVGALIQLDYSINGKHRSTILELEFLASHFLWVAEN